MMLRAGLVAAFVVIAFLSLMKAAGGQRFPNCEEFGRQIPHNCCCTSDCCREAEEGEFRHVRDDIYQSTVTGQPVSRTGWSSDGRTIKCACDNIEGKWVKHPKANVRCLYLPMPSS
jgi:hypothetical protein